MSKMMVTAYRFSSGLIEVGPACPEGALLLVVGRENLVREALNRMAVLAYDNKSRLVPKNHEWGG
jgi:hypothetical protein